MNCINLKCFHCGKSKDILFEGNINFAFQLAQLANESGMYGVIDTHHNRSVVFCDKNCMESELTKKGTIRIRPIGAINTK